MSQLVTGEAVALDLRPAALPSRVVAALLDALAQLALLILLLVAASLAGGGSDAADAAITVLLLVLVTIAYPVGFETAMRGRTPGKAALGLRVVRDDGGPIGFRQALVRGLAGAFLERPGITFFLAAVLTSLLHPAGKRLGDLLAGTVVLQERVPASGGPVAVLPPELAGWAASLDLTGLPDDLALQARQFVSRAPELTEAAREDLGRALVRAVLARVSPPPPPSTPGWAVLAAVLAERRRRDEQRLAVAAPDSWRGSGNGVPPTPGGGAPQAPDVPPAPGRGAPQAPDVPPTPGGGFVPPA